MPGELFPEGVERADERAGGREVAHVLQHVAFGAHRFVGLGQHAGAAVSDDLVHERAGEWISGYARKRVGAPALQGDPQFAQRFDGATLRRYRGQPAAYDALALGEPGGESAIEGEKLMRHIVEWVAVGAHELLQSDVRDRLGAVIDGEDGADVRVHHEPAERAQDFRRVVRLARATTLGVRNRDDAIELGMDAGERLQPGGELAGKTRGVRGRAEDDDGVARADAAAAGPAVTGEGAWRGNARDRRGGAERGFVEVEVLEVVFEVGRGGQANSRHLPHGERLQHRRVGNVVAGRDRP